MPAADAASQSSSRREEADLYQISQPPAEWSCITPPFVSESRNQKLLVRLCGGFLEVSLFVFLCALLRLFLPRLPSNLCSRLGSQRGAQITLASRAGNGHDHLAFVFRPPGHLDSRADVCPGRNAGQNTFLFRQAPSHGKGVVIGHLN